MSDIQLTSTTNSEEINKIYRCLENKNRAYDENTRYAKGNNPKIMSRIRKKDPDNRVPIPLAKMAIETLSGYAGKPENIQVFVEKVNEDANDDIKDELNKFYRKAAEYNTDNIEKSELYQDALTYGEVYELWWTSDKEKVGDFPITPEWKLVPGNSCYPIYSKSLKKELEALYYFEKYEEENKEYLTIYYPLFSEKWARVNGGDWVNTGEFNFYPFKRVPAARFASNSFSAPIFEAEKSTIKPHDELLSSSSNEIDRFNALLLLLPQEVTKEFVDKLIEYKVISGLSDLNGDQFPRYLEKNLEGVTAFYNQLADRLERLFHKSIKVPDFSDENFGGDKSGVAMAYKLLDLEFRASQIEIYFNRGFYDRQELFFDYLESVGYAFERSDYRFVVDSKRNLPVDFNTLLDIAAKMDALGISKETIFKFLPNEIIENYKEELSRMEDEGEELELQTRVPEDEDTEE